MFEKLSPIKISGFWNKGNPGALEAKGTMRYLISFVKKQLLERKHDLPAGDLLFKGVFSLYWKVKSDLC